MQALINFIGRLSDLVNNAIKVTLATSLSLKDAGDTIGVEGYIKSGTVQLYGGAINSSKDITAATEISMDYCCGGSLEVIENSGTGSWSFVLYKCSVSGGTYTPALTSAGTAITVSIPDGGGTVDDIPTIKAKYIKWVANLTGTSNITVNWTPTPL